MPLIEANYQPIREGLRDWYSSTEFEIVGYENLPTEEDFPVVVYDDQANPLFIAIGVQDHKKKEAHIGEVVCHKTPEQSLLHWKLPGQVSLSNSIFVKSTHFWEPLYR